MKRTINWSRYQIRRSSVNCTIRLPLSSLKPTKFLPLFPFSLRLHNSRSSGLIDASQTLRHDWYSKTHKQPWEVPTALPILGAGLSPALPLQDVCFPVQRMPATGPLLDGIGEVWLLAVPEEGRLWPELTARSFILWASEQHLDPERGEQAVSDAKAWRGGSVILPGGSSG